ncbi:MAG: efflux RND transporter periplasmic adaptor subunit [Holosporales bacterium]|jgi:membrane fusion protein (multidrug efflux system)|nr:efflux RND transporter periplasmic adaptor subunit [Holosporales bacterium]
MLKKTSSFFKSCKVFWNNFFSSKDKKEFLRENSSFAVIQVVVLLSSALVGAIIYGCMRPVVKGVCRIVLQSDEDSLEGMFGRVVGVEAKKARIGTTQREIKSIGTLKANAEVVIRSEIPGKMVEISFTEGEEVEKGQVLIKFDDDLFSAEVQKYEAELKLREAEFKRAEQLRNKNVGSQKTYDEALAQKMQAEANLAHAKAQLKRTKIDAPISGRIGILKISPSPGNIVQQHAEIVNIADNSLMRVEFHVPAKFAEDIAPGQSVEIVIDSDKNATYRGIVDAVDSVVDPKNHSILVRAVIPNKSGRLKHGMFANVKLITGEKDNVVLIDEEALDRIGSVEVVWVIDQKGRAALRQVITGARTVDGVEILAGLKEGDIVVIAGQLKLIDGARTRILNKDFYPDEPATGEPAAGDESEEQSQKEKEEEPSKQEESKNETKTDAGTDADDKEAKEEDVTKEEPANEKDEESAEKNEEQPEESSGESSEEQSSGKDAAAEATEDGSGKSVMGKIKDAFKKVLGQAQ